MMIKILLCITCVGHALRMPVPPLPDATQTAFDLTAQYEHTPLIKFAIDYQVSGREESMFFKHMMSELRAHPQHVDDMEKADVIFLEYDSMRQCIYPQNEAVCVLQKHTPPYIPTKPEHPNLWKTRSRRVGGYGTNAMMDPSGWGVDIGDYEKQVEQIRHKMTPRQKLVYFANVNSWWGTEGGKIHYDIHDLRAMQERLGMKEKMLVVGLDLVKSHTQPTDTNLVMPLLPKGPYYKMEEEQTLCKARPTLASFVGFRSRGPVREQLFNLNKSRKEILDQFHINIVETPKWGQDSDMAPILQKSQFGLAPRGDSHYSFRIAETLSAGAVPVIIDDEYTPPTNFKNWAVQIPEKNISQIPEILKSFDQKDICRMQIHGRKFIQNHARNMKGMVEDMVGSLGRAFSM